MQEDNKYKQTKVQGGGRNTWHGGGNTRVDGAAAKVGGSQMTVLNSRGVLSGRV